MLAKFVMSQKDAHDFSDNAQIMLSIMTDIIYAGGKDSANFDVLGPILQKHLQVSDKEAKTLMKLFYDVFCIEELPDDIIKAS